MTQAELFQVEFEALRKKYPTVKVTVEHSLQFNDVVYGNETPVITQKKKKK